MFIVEVWPLWKVAHKVGELLFFLLILFNASKFIGLTFMDVGVCVADWCLLTELDLTTVFVLFVYFGASLNYMMNNMASFRVGE